MARHAVCYIASDGHLFQTFASAVQARANLSAAADVVIVALDGSSSPSQEQRVFEALCREHGIVFILASLDDLGGMHPMFGRLFFDRFLPAEIEEILYLDGDTQIVASLDPLMFAEAPVRGTIAVRDPMVFIHDAVPAFRKVIVAQWDRSRIPEALRRQYLNSGVLRMSRATLAELQAQVVKLRGATTDLHFADQDLINLALEDRVDLVSMEWNFPGFLLSSVIESKMRPRIIHFMSDPRPWNSALWPWGLTYYQPYVDIVLRHPQLEPYWERIEGLRRVKYQLQQAYKKRIEGSKWQSTAAWTSLQAVSAADRHIS